MKKFIVSMLLASTLLIPFHSARSSVALMSGNLLIGIVGISTFIGAGELIKRGTDEKGNIFFFVGGMLTGFVSALILDQESGNVSINQISEEDAFKINISITERIAFNNNIEELKLTLKSLNEQSQNIEEAQALWSEFRNDIDQDAVSAFEKIIKNINIINTKE